MAKYHVRVVDPRVGFEVGSERGDAIERRVDEVVDAMVQKDPAIFVSRANDLAIDIDNQLSKLTKEVKPAMIANAKKAGGKDAGKVAKFIAEAEREIEMLREHQELRRRTPSQLEGEAREEIYGKAVAVLQNLHAEHMVARLRHFQITCRCGGCEKKPRTKRGSGQGTKGRRGTQLFCKAHACLKNNISHADFRRLIADANLRVILTE